MNSRNRGKNKNKNKNKNKRGKKKGQKKNNNKSSPKKTENTSNEEQKTAETNGTVTTTTTTNQNGSSNNKSKSKSGSQSTSNEETKEEKKEEKKDVKTLLMQRPTNPNKDPDRKHKFWDKQPVPQHKEKVDPSKNGPKERKIVAEVRQIPLLLPAQFEWVELDLTNPTEVDEIYHLLANHYVEDDDNRFRFNYSREFLQWALLVPNYKKQWHLGVRAVKTGALYGCITAIPAKVNIYGKTVNMVEINFLCVHKKLRANRLAPVLISEITRRVNVTDIWQAVFTAGIVIFEPIAANRYWHRSLNPEKLVDVGFSTMNKLMTKPRLRKLYKLPTKVKCTNLRPMLEKDCESAHKLLTNYLSKFALFVHFTLDEFKHCFLTKKGIVYSFVVEDKTSGEMTDFISFYELPSTIMNHAKYKGMRAAYSYYNAVTSVSWKVMMKDALVLAKQLKFDVFNCLDVMENDTFLKDLKFKIGDGHLQYYLYNWECTNMKPSQVALVLL